VPTIRLPIEESSQCAEARRIAQKLAAEAGFNEVRAGQVSIVVVEVATNILKHAGRGEILLHVTRPEGAPPGLEVLALDKGPGMRDIEVCLRDGFTTASSPGQGLGAIRRLADESDFYSVPGEGTAVLARWSTPPRVHPFSAEPHLLVGAVNVAKYGQEFCGDSWGIEQSEDFSTVLLADGLGHGFEASQASLEALRVLRENPDLAPGLLIDLSHRALRSLRGAALSIAKLDRMRDKITFSGLGNVAGYIFSGAERCHQMVSVSGTAGHHAARIREFSYPWPANGILIMHSDGLSTNTGLDSRPGLAHHDPTLIAGALYRDFNRGHDDATVVVARAA